MLVGAPASEGVERSRLRGGPDPGFAFYFHSLFAIIVLCQFSAKSHHSNFSFMVTDEQVSLYTVSGPGGPYGYVNKISLEP